jgi:hypothetical protein
MRIYISGQISGLPLEQARSNFKKTAKIVRKLGHQPINPMQQIPYIDGKEWIEYMIEGLELLKNCDAIILLDDWKLSHGAKIEKLAAERIELEMFGIIDGHVQRMAMFEP